MSEEPGLCHYGWVTQIFVFPFKNCILDVIFYQSCINEKVAKISRQITRHQKIISLISIFRITLINTLKKNCEAKLVWHIFAASILLQLSQAGEKGRKYLNKGGKDASQSYFATNISCFWASRGHISEWMRSNIKIQMCSDLPIFFSDF